MTIRKLNHDGPQARGLPDPTSPSSPVNQQFTTNSATTAKSEINPWQNEHKGKIGAQTEYAVKGNESQLPPSSRISGGRIAKNYGGETGTPPASLHIRPVEMTPRSSLDSERSKRSRSASPAFDDIPEQPPSLSRLASNNPFLNHTSTPMSTSTQSGSEESSATVWANGPALPPDNSPHTGLENNKATKHSKEVPYEDPWNDLSTSRTPDLQLNPKHSYSGDSHELPTSVFESRPLPEEHHTNGNRHLPTLPTLEYEKGLPPLPARDQAEAAPTLPPRRTESFEETPPPKPPRPHIDTAINGDDTASRAQVELDRRRKQRSETYQIRLVNWFDASSSINPRRSPIMVQNANGPCPLLALVNALVLSTRAGLDTALLDTLERREQVSLGLLLDAVIDELMSGRRGDAAQNLPDVSELYAFLVNLHTGMNVNPSFLPKESETLHLLDAPIPGENASLAEFGNAGSFENTREMKLYSTFAVPLTHGWLPSTTHPACAALRRSAKTYEDAQNLMFAEEELENKLSQQGLDQDEQSLLQDIASVKYFLSSSATQLTDFGLNQITESLRPGSIAILFRNDHFSTLYRNPRSGQLFTLVTDMGYAGHDEVVWESLVDISGEGCEFFAGDFRPVGNNNLHPNISAADDNDGWTTVGRSHTDSTSHNHTYAGFTNNPPDISSLHLGSPTQNPTSPKAEQEDHDLALALQLQEEEEERERQETAARRREDELSHAFLSSQPGSRGHGAKRGPEIRPSIPPRGNTSGRFGGAGGRGGSRNARGSGASSTETRPVVPPQDGDEAPPPTYEQAAKGPAYHPPPNHPAHPYAASTSPTISARPNAGPHRHSSAYTQNAGRLGNSPVTSNPASSPFSSSPSIGGSRARNNASRNPGSGRGGPSGVEGAPGVNRRNGAKVVDEADRRPDCILM